MKFLFLKNIKKEKTASPILGLKAYKARTHTHALLLTSPKVGSEKNKKMLGTAKTHRRCSKKVFRPLFLGEMA